MAFALEAARLFVIYALPAIVGCGSVGFCVLLLRRLQQLQSKVVRGEEQFRTATATWTRSLAALGKEIENIEVAAKHLSGDPAREPQPAGKY